MATVYGSVFTIYGAKIQCCRELIGRSVANTPNGILNADADH